MQILPEILVKTHELAEEQGGQQEWYRKTRGINRQKQHAAGLAIPFLLTTLLLSQFMRFYQNFRKYLHAVEIFSGALLLFVGALVFINKLTWLSGKLTFLNRLSL